MVAQTYQSAEKPSTHANMDIKLEQGTFLKREIKLDEAKSILAIACLWGHYSLRDAYVKLNTHNKRQRLKQHPNIAFGRGQNHVWFAYCDDKGDLLSRDAEPIAAIFFKN